MSKPKPLTKTMLSLIDYIGQATLYRHAGGFWKRDEHWVVNSPSFGGSSVEALVSRGIAEYTQWKDGKNGRFPIQARLISAEQSRADEVAAAAEAAGI